MDDEKKITVRDVLLHTKITRDEGDGVGDRDLQTASDSGNIALRNEDRQEWGVRQFDDASWATHITYKGKVVEFDREAVLADRDKNNYTNSLITQEEAKTPRNDNLYDIKSPSSFGGIERKNIGALLTYKKALEAHEKTTVRFLSEKPFEGKVLGSIELGVAHYNVLKGDNEWMIAKKTPELNSMGGDRVRVVGEVQENGYLKVQITNISAQQRRDKEAIQDRELIASLPKFKGPKSTTKAKDKKKDKGGFER